MCKEGQPRLFSLWKTVRVQIDKTLMAVFHRDFIESGPFLLSASSATWGPKTNALNKIVKLASEINDVQFSSLSQTHKTQELTKASSVQAQSSIHSTQSARCYRLAYVCGKII